MWMSIVGELIELSCVGKLYGSSFYVLVSSGRNLVLVHRCQQVT